MRYDYCVIGGGIVGLATAMVLLERRAGASLVLLEKENGLAAHETGQQRREDDRRSGSRLTLPRTG